MMKIMETKKDYASVFGVVSGISAYLIWGLSPVYWKELQVVTAFEIIVHRIVWSFLFLLILVIVRKQFGQLIAIIKSPRIMLLLVITSLFVSSNWLVYIWSVNHGFIVQASLGYYINPLVNILLGMIFLKERLRRLQILAVGLAFCGVLFLTVFYRAFPWVSLTLAFTFGLYALIRKTAAVGALIGLTMETLLLSIPALIYLVYLKQAGQGAFGQIDGKVDLMLAGTALVTAIPLLLFNLAGKRLMLATLGFLQYLAPTCMLAIGVVVWGNVLVPAQLISFLFIWVALALYSVDSVYSYRINHRRTI
jgi:chloramphenicol-sensitive protein RarD